VLKRFSPQSIVVRALAGAVVAGAAFVGLALAHAGGLPGFLLPVWSILAAMGLVIPNAPAVALSRHHEAAGTAAALLGAAQFGIGAAVAPVVGVLGNDELALAVVMTAGVVIALIALVTVIRRTGAAPSSALRASGSSPA
jgi:MFS transporter, DHA1 family, multidrug resistance protein